MLFTLIYTHPWPGVVFHLVEGSRWRTANPRPCRMRRQRGTRLPELEPGDQDGRSEKAPSGRKDPHPLKVKSEVNAEAFCLCFSPLLPKARLALLLCVKGLLLSSFSGTDINALIALWRPDCPLSQCSLFGGADFVAKKEACLRLNHFLGLRVCGSG